jgi:ComF family protein
MSIVLAHPPEGVLPSTSVRRPSPRLSLSRMLMTALLDVLAPPRCAGCDRPGRVLCETCVEAIDATPTPLISGARAAFPFSSEVRRVLHCGKFRDCRSALRTLAWMGAARLQAPPGSLVTAVPLSRRRAAERGYNQAQVVAQALADFHRLRDAVLLTRSRHTQPQSALDRSARRANVAGAFNASSAALGATVWLVDDVLTTGATVAAARQALLSAGAARVEVAALAAVL